METAADRTSRHDRLLGWILAILVPFTLVAAMTSCQTYAVITEAPEEFWMTAENLVVAFFADIWSLIDHVFL